MSFELPPSIQLVFVAFWGLCLGSFINVVIVRLPRGKSIVRPSSRCGWCRSPLTAFQNFPLLGYLKSWGQCTKCGASFSSRYFWIELLAAILSVAVWSVYGWTWSTLVFAAFALTLLAVTFIDLELKIIPDELSFGGWAVALLVTALAPQLVRLSLLESVIGSFVGYGFFWIVSRLYQFFRHEDGLGGGDVKLMGFIGAVLGLQGVFTTI